MRDRDAGGPNDGFRARWAGTFRFGCVQEDSREGKPVLKRIAIPVVAAVTACTAYVPPVAAHNPSIHQAMTDLAWQMMVFVENTGVDRIGEGDAAWNAFLRRVAATPPRYHTQPAGLHDLISSRTDPCTPALASWKTTLRGIPAAPRWDFKDLTGCGVNTAWKPSLDTIPPNDFSGAALGHWAGFPDSAYDDTHLWYRLTNAAGLGAVRDIVNQATEDLLTIALVPIVCFIDWLFGDGDDCVEHSRKIADDVDVGEEITGWIPGVHDISNDDYVGVWHFIDMNPDASNEYDARQGKLFDEAGVPGAPMDPLELVLMAFFDTSGLSVNYDKSAGVANYTADTADDGVARTIRRDKAKWQFTTVAHVPFEPVNNLAYFGWTRFRDEQIHPVRMLAWPLHAIGDAIVPMHVTGTSAWGHRPFEDSQDTIWDSVWNFKIGQRETQRPAVERVMRRAFEWWKVIEAWRAARGGTKDIPIRQIIVDLAAHTHEYAMAKHAETNGDWPFSSTASTTYLVAKNETIKAYAETSGAAELVRPLYENGMGAIVALLVAGADFYQ
jgi:hypothetical protein